MLKIMGDDSLRLQVGDKAPDFTLPSQTGENVSPSNFLGKKKVVLYFYPMNESPVCTREAQSFRDSYEVFKGLEAQVIGVNSSSVESQKAFGEHHKLPFLLLSDVDNKIRKLYGATSSFGALPGRVTYVIDKKGIVRHVFSSLLQPKKHVKEALDVLRKINAPEEGVCRGGKQETNLSRL